MKFILCFTMLLAGNMLNAQHKIQQNTSYLKSVGGTVKKMLSIISGGPGKQRDWDEFRNLFLPTAYFIVVNHIDSNPRQIDSATLEDFIHSMDDDYYKNGYIEYELSKVVNEYNGIANVFQTFYGRDSEGQVEHGINSYQLVNVNKRWWIANVVWALDANGTKIPSKYLPKARPSAVKSAAK